MPISASEFKLQSVQAVILTPDVATFSPTNLLTQVLTQFPGRYNGPPVVLPYPDDLPPEAPRVVLRSSDNIWHLQAGPTRVDAFFLMGDVRVENPVQECAGVLMRYVTGARIRVNRVALVITRIHESPDAVPFLIQKFCNETAKELFNQTEDFEVHSRENKALPQTEWAISHMIRCKGITGIKQPEQTEVKLVIVEQDINTQDWTTGTPVYSNDDIAKFFECAENEISATLERYFPSV